MSLLDARVGEQTLSPGALAPLRLGRDGSVVLSPRYRELAREGRVYGAVTAASGVAPGTAIGTTAAFDLWLPSGSDVVLELIACSVGYVSGTLGAGVMQYITHVRSEVAHTGTAIESINVLTYSRGGKGRALTTATVPASGLAVRNLCSLGASLASSVVAPWQVVDQIDGVLYVSEGRGLSIQATAAAGTSPLVVIGALWAEVPA